LLAGIAVTFLAMFASVFTPGQGIFLHIVAALSVAAAALDIWRADDNSEPPDAVICR